MKSFATKTLDDLRRLIIIGDYAFWLLADPSKFTIINKKKIKKVLIIHLGAIGEILASTPILPVLKKSLKAKITYMVSPGKKVLLENNPNVDEVIEFQKDFWKNVEMLKNGNFDIAFVIYPTNPKLNLACILAGIKLRVAGFKGIKDGPSLFFTRRMLDLRKKHAVQCNLDVIRTIGLDNKNPKLELRVSDKDKLKVTKLLKDLKVKDFVIIHPGSSFSTQLEYPSRAWPLERYAKVADFILENYNLKVIVTGSPDENKFAEELIKKTKNKKGLINLSGKLMLGETMALVSKAKLVIVTSTGVAHIASALGTKMVHLSGPDETHWHPWASEKQCKIIQHAEVCTGCEHVYCRKKTQECILAITPEEVINGVKEMLK